MSRTLLLSLLIYGLILAGLATLQGALLALALPLVVYLAAGLLAAPQDVRLEISRNLRPNRVVQDAPTTVLLSLTNRGGDLAHVQVQDILPPELTVIEGEARAQFRLPAGASVEIEYVLQGPRGAFALDPVLVTVRDPLGLRPARFQLSAPAQLFILPRVHRLPAIALRPRRTRVYPGLIPARKGGPGVEFFGVREYKPGDPLRWINHRASARFENTLFVNAFEQERAVDVGLILDVRASANLCAGDRSMLEYTVQAAATLADALLQYGNRVGLFLYGGSVDWTFPGYGKVQRERILRALARARLERSQVFDKLQHLPTRLFPAHSQLVLISPLQANDLEDLVSLRAHGYPLLVLAPDVVDFERKTIGEHKYLELAVRIARLERAHLFRQMSRAGVQIFTWRVDEPFHQVAYHVLGRASMWSRSL